MEPNNNNNNFSSPQKQGVAQGYVQQRVFGERLRENNNRDEVEAQINNNRVQNNELPAFARILNFDNLRINNFPNPIGLQNSTVAGSDYEDSSIDSSMDSRGVSRGTHLLSEASSNASDVEGLPFSDYEERFPELGNSSIEPKIVKKVKSDSRSK